MRSVLAALFLFSLGGSLAACEETTSENEESEAAAPSVRGDADGFLLTWFDQDGPHMAESREEVPEDHRGRVRVQPLSLGPDEADPDQVWLANLRDPSSDGTYVVESMSRAEFDAMLDERSGVAFEEVPVGEEIASADIVIYGASWCHACRSAASYLRSKNVAFIERDIEAEPGARAEMQAKARAAGINPSGIPVIDFRGTMLTGFDQRRIDSLLLES